MPKNEIYIEWNNPKPELDASSIVDSNKINEAIQKYNTQYPYDKYDQNRFLSRFQKIYQAGTIKNGLYKNKNLLIITMRPEDPFPRNLLLRVIQNNKELIVLSGLSDPLYGIDKEFFKEEDLKIINLTYPSEISLPNTSVKLIAEKSGPLELASVYQPAEKVYSSQDIDLYFNNNGCYFIELPDGTIKHYLLDTGFNQSRQDSPGLNPRVPTLLSITWNNGQKNVSEYPTHWKGCRSLTPCYEKASYITSKNQLQITGQTKTGDNIYELKEGIVPENSQDKKGVLAEMYDSYLRFRQDGVSWSEFIAQHPLIFWQDPFGNYLAFQNAELQPVAECGKPVIYLYPPASQDVVVYVQPNGGLTFTEPFYSNGWKVKAHPDGQIYNYADQKTYPYLFWEGRAVKYKRPQKGFVVAKENIKSFLEKKLSQLGLIKKEYDEFIKFWQPKMQKHKYYFITFLPQQELDKIAPLSVYPQPDTVIRVFMDFEGLDQPISVQEPLIRTPSRKGFVVVEWGGALHEHETNQ